jgi:hypothetical protein
MATLNDLLANNRWGRRARDYSNAAASVSQGFGRRARG